MCKKCNCFGFFKYHKIKRSYNKLKFKRNSKPLLQELRASGLEERKALLADKYNNKLILKLLKRHGSLFDVLLVLSALPSKEANDRHKAVVAELSVEKFVKIWARGNIANKNSYKRQQPEFFETAKKLIDKIKPVLEKGADICTLLEELPQENRLTYLKDLGGIEFLKALTKLNEGILDMIPEGQRTNDLYKNLQELINGNNCEMELNNK